MKFPIDNQLPVTLKRFFIDRGLECRHVLDENLAQAVDAEICRHAEANNCIVISKDEDFVYYAKRPATKLRLIWVRLGNCRTPKLLAAFERSWREIETCLEAGDRIVELR